MPKARPIDHQRLFKRFSQITGIPVKSLRPHRSVYRPPWSRGVYNADKHTFSSTRDKFVEQHEERHAIQNMANLRLHPKRKRMSIKDSQRISDAWIEPTNTDHLEKLLTWTLIRSRYRSFRDKINYIVRRTFVKGVIKHHGEDGLLLLWAAPPKKLDALYVRSWEKQMVNNGYLQPNGGFTRKGLQYWREHVQAQAIWQFLKKAEQEREKETAEKK